MLRAGGRFLFLEHGLGEDPRFSGGSGGSTRSSGCWATGAVSTSTCRPRRQPALRRPPRRAVPDGAGAPDARDDVSWCGDQVSGRSPLWRPTTRRMSFDGVTAFGEFTCRPIFGGQGLHRRDAISCISRGTASWKSNGPEGTDDRDNPSGHGWAVVEGDRLKGMIFNHQGDDPGSWRNGRPGQRGDD